MRQIDVIFAPVMASRAMRSLDRTLRAVADKDVVVTLVGESGSGKDLLARRVHELSPNRAGPFVPINCAAIPDALFESELFGHERGAFTGANERVRGKIEAAHGGTLFLDEISEMPIAGQAKLLRFLENRRFMRVGGSAKVEVDVRLVCAAQRPLEDDVRRGRFRADLFYRIQGVTLTVPPLRERRADIRPLVRQLVEQLSAKHGVESPRMTRSAMRALCAHAWPGNIRELRNAIELVCILRAGRTVRVHDLPPSIREAVPLDDTAAAPTKVLEIRLDRPLDDTVDQIIRAAVALEQGNRARAAARLGIGLRTVQRHLR
jgi:DNA-binding NtrC family response regulator